MDRDSAGVGMWLVAEGMGSWMAVGIRQGVTKIWRMTCWISAISVYCSHLLGGTELSLDAC